MQDALHQADGDGVANDAADLGIGDDRVPALDVHRRNPLKTAHVFDREAPLTGEGVVRTLRGSRLRQARAHVLHDVRARTADVADVFDLEQLVGLVLVALGDGQQVLQVRGVELVLISRGQVRRQVEDGREAAHFRSCWPREWLHHARGLDADDEDPFAMLWQAVLVRVEDLPRHCVGLGVAVPDVAEHGDHGAERLSVVCDEARDVLDHERLWFVAGEEGQDMEEDDASLVPDAEVQALATERLAWYACDVQVDLRVDGLVVALRQVGEDPVHAPQLLHEPHGGWFDLRGEDVLDLDVHAFESPELAAPP